MSLLRAFRGETYRTSVRSSKSPAIAFRTSRSIQIKNAARVLPDPVGAEISVVSPAKICGHPSSCGSVGVPNRATNQSRTSGCAHSRLAKGDLVEEVAFIAVALHYSARPKKHSCGFGVATLWP